MPIPTSLNELLILVSFVVPLWLAFWRIERRGDRATDREKLITLGIALWVALLLALIGLLLFR